ncbi:TIGR04086 family membrane protein [Desulfolucanica intricata]|uniref:TIGR04086 family membrane protein n=1 Tax=Desulfolucanica intricata TaxID=1285191 RepID=UPI0008321FBC|nr:TIGR04086 family membrane protein [Desulfolucanica intricata]
MKRLTFFRWSGQGRWGRQGLNLGAVLIGMVWTLSVTVAIAMAVGLWVIFSSGESFYLSGIISAVTLLSTAIGGGISGRLAGNLGWMHGILVGIIYSILLLILAVLASPQALAFMPVAVKVFFLLLSGTLGGVLGVNIPGHRRIYRRLPY